MVEYIDIRIRGRDIAEAFQLKLPDGSDPTEPAATRRQAQRGRKQEYSVDEFQRLCIWEASLNGLPPTQAEFVKRMYLIVDLVWGKAPGDSWPKEHISEIYRVQDRYEAARQRLGAPAIPD